MARRESPKEDLVRDATAFAIRAELRWNERDETIFFGRRSDGGASIYFADESFVAFNARGEVRRAFQDGVLYKAQRGTLVAMRRERTPDATILASEEGSSAEVAEWTKELASTLSHLASATDRREMTVLRAADDEEIAFAAFREWIRAAAARPVVIAQTPSAGG